MLLGYGSMGTSALLVAAGQVPPWLYNIYLFVLVIVAFSIIIFVHELGHFLAAKWVGVRVDRFAVGFGYRLFGYRKGEGFTFGDRPDYNPDELRDRGFGETDYCFKALPIGGYVRMLGQDDVIIDDKSGDIRISDDPRAFPNRPVGQRMIVVSAGVIFNLIFAALLLGGMFMYGVERPAPVITVPAEHAAYGTIQTGDRILSINGNSVESFRDLVILPILSNGNLDLTLERDGNVLRDIYLEAPKSVDTGLRSIGVLPYAKLKVVVDSRPVRVPAETAPEGLKATPDDSGFIQLPALRKGDQIVDVNGIPVENFEELAEEFRASDGRLLTINVEREDPDSPDSKQTVTVYQRAELTVVPNLIPDGTFEPLAFVKASHILGMHRRPQIRTVIEGGPAGDAGLKADDIVVEWDTIQNPTYAEVLTSIRSSTGKPIRVTVERNGKRVGPLHVTPKRPFQLFGQTAARIQAEFYLFEYENPVVADVEPDTPAAALNLPRGARLTAIDETPVHNWNDVVRLLFAAAGREAKVAYRSGQSQAEAGMRVPASIVNALGFTDQTIVINVAGQSKVSVRGRDLPIGGNPVLLAEALRQHVSKTVTIEYREKPNADPKTAEYAVVADEVDPWQLRLRYEPSNLKPDVKTVTVSAHGNPIEALRMGGKEVVSWVVWTYLIMKQMVSREVGVQHVSGPVGIFAGAMEQARASWMDLFNFMAIISINLAVLNFLPIPVMDGGLMVFLLIEKIKGKPLSIKTQMVTTLVGLAAILLIAILVTVQDIGRLF